MDKFLTHQGQQPIWLGDFDFFDKAVRDTFRQVLKIIALGHDTLVLYGCEGTMEATDVSEESYDLVFKWNDGVVLLDGEILPVKAGQISYTTTIDNPQIPVFSAVNSYDASGRRMMKDGSTVDCYQIRRATVVASGVSQDKYRADVPIKLDDILKEYIEEAVPKYYDKIFGFGISGGSLNPNTGVVAYSLYESDFIEGDLIMKSTGSTVFDYETIETYNESDKNARLYGVMPLMVYDDSFSDIRIIAGHLQAYNSNGKIAYRLTASESIAKGKQVSFHGNLNYRQ